MSSPRPVSRRAVLGGAATLGALPLIGGAGPASANSDPLVTIFNRVNDFRAAHGRPRLPIEHRLTAVSQAWSAHLRDRGSLAHNPDAAAEYGWPASAHGEVVAYSGGQGDDTETAHRVVDAWISSSSHRSILLGDFTDLGIGWSTDRPGGRMYGVVNLIRTSVPGVGQEALGITRLLISNGSAHRAVVVRDDVAADAIAASGLVDPTTPLLLARAGQPLPGELVEELARVLVPGGTVHLVGGGLVSTVDDQVRGIGATPRRLRGTTRYETAALVAREVIAVRGTPFMVLLVSGESWPDAVSAGGYAALHGLPVLLTPAGSLHPRAEGVLADLSGAQRVIVGGAGVVTDPVRRAADARRVAGADRAETGVAVMRELFQTSAQRARDLVVTPGWTGDGWATALAHLPICAREVPLLFAGNGMPPAVADGVRAAGFGASAPATLHFARHVPESAREAFRAATS